MSKYGKRGISLIVLIITIIVTIIIATAIILSIAKNNPITKADEAVFKQDVQVVREMLNDEIADISLKEMMPPTFYTNGGYETKLEDAANMRIRINRLAETPTVGYLYYMVNGKKGCIVFGREEEAKIVTELASNGETSLPNVEYRYTGRELPKYKYKTVLWYVTASNSVALEINDGEYVIDDIKTYYLNLDANGGTITKTTYVQDEEATFTIPNETPTKTGENAEYRFLNWKEEGTENVYNPGDTITLTGKESVKLIAQYKEIITYTLKYDLNGGSGTFENVSQRDNSTFVLPSTKPTKEVDGLTYEFKEWKDETNNRTYNVGSSVTILTGTEVTLKAIWQIKYTLSYDLDGGSGTFNSVTQYDNPTFVLPSTKPTKEVDGIKYGFKEWKDETNNRTYNVGSSVTILTGTGVTLKAIWKDYRTSFTSSGLTNEIGANAYDGNKSTSWDVPRTDDWEDVYSLSLPNNSGGRIVDITFSLYGYYGMIEIGFIDSNGNHISPYYCCVTPAQVSDFGVTEGKKFILAGKNIFCKKIVNEGVVTTCSISIPSNAKKIFAIGHQGYGQGNIYDMFVHD